MRLRFPPSDFNESAIDELIYCGLSACVSPLSSGCATCSEFGLNAQNVSLAERM